MSFPRIIQFHDINQDDAVGGKASGLARLIDMQLYVPPGFVILDAEPGNYPAKLEQNYLALGGGKVAVRSSAIGEDSAGASFAGQYETILDVDGIEELQAAIDQCLNSTVNERASAYRSDQTSLGNVPMAIVVQEMVNAKSAGVLFTVDPVSNRRDHMVIDAVKGTGEKLVSGEATPDHYVFDRSKGKLITKELTGNKSILNPDNFRQLIKESQKAEQIAGEPLDMEWAIDEDGDICWLQARPITTLSSDLNELDTTLPTPDQIYTKCNVSEALPGALCPLTHSVTGQGLEIGMQRVLMDVDLLDKEQEQWIMFGSFYGHLFINMSGLALTPRKVLGTSADDMSLAVCGRVIPELDQQVDVPPLKERLPRIIKHIKTVLSGKKQRQRLQELADTLELPQQNTVLEQWQMIDTTMEPLHAAHHAHLVSSMGAGMMAPLLLGILAKGQTPTDEHHMQVAALLAGAEDVESADIAKGATDIQQLLLKQPHIRERFINVSAPEAYSYLRSSDSGAAGKAFFNYLKRHGHRSISEMDIRIKEWASDPMPLIESLQIPLKGMIDQEQTAVRPATSIDSLSNEKILAEQNFVVKKLVGIAHKAIRGREASKSLLVKVKQKYKAAYRQLGQMMVAEGLITDNDQLYFFTHQELGELIRSQNTEMLKQADMRRKALDQQQNLTFPDVFTGVPTPVKPDLDKIPADQLVKGKTVSRGKVMGHAKIARTVAEAQKLEAGDILIAPITDVAWTPYFSLIGGLVTDIGSSVSHGAVVAREYGLPAIVKTDIGTQTFKDGDVVILDANEGYVRIATEQEAKIFHKKSSQPGNAAAA